jgi:hypothetical protein
LQIQRVPDGGCPTSGQTSEIRPDTGQCQAARRLRSGGCSRFFIRIPVPIAAVPTAVPSANRKKGWSVGKEDAKI